MSRQIPLKIDDKNILLQNYQSSKRNADQKQPGTILSVNTIVHSAWAKLSGGAKLKKLFFSETRKKFTPNPNTISIDIVTPLLETIQYWDLYDEIFTN